MASPAAHSLTGAIIYFAFKSRHRLAARDLWWLILAANIADFDLIPGMLTGDHALFHRTLSHSVLGSLLFAFIVYVICRWRNHHSPGRFTLLMFTAYASQLMVDWLSLDTGPPAGLPLFWPFDDEHYMASPTVFLNIERTGLFSPEVIIHNIKAVILEIVILGPPAALLWWWSRER